jgi:hypothetical protein
MMIALWDNLQTSDPTSEHVSQVRIATAYLWPVLAQATDRQDFENRWAVVEPNVRREAQKVSDDPSIPLRVRAAYAQDFLTVEAARPAPILPKEVAAPRVFTEPGSQKVASVNKEAKFFTRHHYNLVAHILHSYHQHNGPVDGLVDSFSSALAQDNPHFDPKRFGEAVQNGVSNVNFSAPMSRGHFNLIASAIASAPTQHRERLANTFASALKATNPNFNGDRFVKATQPKETKIGSFEIDAFGGIRLIGSDESLHCPNCNAGSTWISSGDRGKHCQSCGHSWDPNDVEEMGPALSYAGYHKQSARLSSDEAREIASQWHGGQSSPLYSFASSGYLHPDMEQEIGQNMYVPQTPEDEDNMSNLNDLHDHVVSRRPEGWHYMDPDDQDDWAIKEHQREFPHLYREDPLRRQSQCLDNGVQLIRGASGKLLRVASYHDPIAYTYEADFHCPHCAENRFGRDKHGDVNGEDREGNGIGAIFHWDDTPPGTECATCGREITPDDPDDDENQSWKTAGKTTTNAIQRTPSKRGVGDQIKRLVSRRPKTADWDNMPSNPFTPSTNQGNLQGNSDLPSGGSVNPYTPSNSGAVPAMSSTDVGQSGATDETIPPNIRDARQRKIDAIADDLRYANPGVTASQAIALAVQTIDRYPSLVVEARGGADYIPRDSFTPEVLNTCPQCGKDALSDATGTCHNCGFVYLNG